jgi:beta-lactam-binding protein with PASTA domain
MFDLPRPARSEREPTVRCPYCGTANDEGARFCANPECARYLRSSGAGRADAAEPPEDATPTPARTPAPTPAPAADAYASGPEAPRVAPEPWTQSPPAPPPPPAGAALRAPETFTRPRATPQIPVLPEPDGPGFPANRPPPPPPPPPMERPAGPVPPVPPSRPPANYGEPPAGYGQPVVLPPLPEPPPFEPPIPPIPREPVARGPSSKPAPGAAPVDRAAPAVARSPRQYRFTRPRAEPVQVDAIDSEPLDQAPSSLFSGSSTDGRQGLVVILDDGEADVMAGSEHVALVRVRNTGSIVERVDLRIDGSPRAWATFEPPQLNIDQGDEEIARLRFTPPREATTMAGPALYDVFAWSLSNPAVRVAAHGRLNVQPFSVGSVSIDGLITETRRSGDYVVTVANQGNVPLVAAVDAHDEPRALRIHTSRYEVEVPPGGSTSFQMDVRPRRRIIVGSPVDHRLSVVVTPHGGAPLRGDAVLTQKPYLPRWAPKAAVIGTVLTVLILAVPVKRWLDTRPRAVPNVVELSEGKASERLTEAGFKVSAKQVFDAKPNGEVVSQDPPANRELSGGGTVALSVSKGLKPVKIPVLTKGLPVTQVRKQLEDAGLVVTETRRNDEKVPNDQILAIEPTEGTEVPAGSPVKLTVSDGPEQIPVPDLTDLRRSEALSVAQQKGLSLVFQTVPQTDREPDTVFNQVPAPGRLAKKGDTITALVTPPPTPTTVAPIFIPGPAPGVPPG